MRFDCYIWTAAYYSYVNKKTSRRSLGFHKLAGIGLLTVLACMNCSAQTNVTTQHNDIARTGSYTNETILTPANVNVSTFGKLFSQPVDGWLYAQPLYVAGVTMGTGTSQPGTTHNVVFVATEHNSVYAFDADSNSGLNANPLWKVSLIDAAHGASAEEKTVPNSDVASADIVPEIGITSTPVIDLGTNTIYVVAKSTVADTTFIQRLHALDITTGQEKFGGPIALSGSVPGNGNGSSGGILNWDPKWHNQRPGLLLANGIVYIGFGSHGDNGPWHGWILAYNAATLQQTGAWCSTPNAAAAGIWMSGSGLAADVPTNKPYGRMFIATGNGSYDAVAPGYTNLMNYGDSILKLDLGNGVPTMNSSGTVVGDEFTPHDQGALNSGDQDVASGGVLLLPDSVGGGNGQHQLIQTGKSGRVYVLNRETLGGYTPGNATDPQEKAYVGGMWAMPAYWNGNVYIWGSGDHLKAYSFINGALSTSPTSISNETLQASAIPAVSSNGTSNGIVWVVNTFNREIFYAYDALNVSNMLYNSGQNSARDFPGADGKFLVPTIANGKVYVGSAVQINVYGLLNGAVQAATPAISPISQSFNPSIAVTITDSTAGAKIYYTTDGSTPTTTSTVYNGSLTVTSTTTVKAIAAGSGLLASPVASTTYTLTSQAVAPTFNPPAGDFTTTQSVTLSTSTPNATIYYTTDGSTPTTSSAKYSSPISVATTETITAIAAASGLSNSPPSSGLYTISNGGSSINFSAGFTAGGMALLGSAKLNGTSLQLTDGGASEAAAAWYNVGTNIQNFTTDFTFLITPASGSTADGFTFTMQGNNASGMGDSGGALGYAGATNGIPNSVAVKFDLYNNYGEGSDSTGLYTNASMPATPANDMTSSGVNLHSGNPMHVHMTYDGTTLSMTIKDTVTNASFSQSWPINIPGTVGNTVAYIGFTGGTGGSTAVQQIQNWTFVSGASRPSTPTPTFSLAGGVYLGTQTVSISDAVAGASILYTTDGTTPGTTAGGSTLAYSGPITVSSTKSINAIAIASGYSPSTVASATYTIESQVPAPTFSPAGGTFTSAQTVTISDSVSGATIYYTTDGKTVPTTSSAQYRGPITVSSSETIQAIAAASGYFNSSVSSAIYTISSGGSTTINLGSGFTAGAMTLNGSATLNGTRLRLTSGAPSQAGTAWYGTQVNIQQFNSNFSFQITGGTTQTADGFTFTIQGLGPAALGGAGASLGYAGGQVPITNSIAIKFDLYNNSGEGPDSTGVYTNGASPTVPAVDMTSSGLNLHTNDIFNVRVSYDGTNLIMNITDTITNASFSNSWSINIPGTIGSNAAYVGFTGGTGGQTSIQEIIGWTLSSSAAVPAATPVIAPATGTYSGAQAVTITNSSSGATIYYTTNGTAPTTSSTKYVGSFTVNATTTVQAMAAGGGFTQSPTASSTITIASPAAAPVIAPATGTYSGPQTITITDSSSGATIYYTTNGTAPTTSSSKYFSSFTVNSTATVQAMASGGGFTQSPTASSTITIQTGGSTIVNFASGFSAAGLQFNGHTKLNGTRLQLTDTTTSGEAGSAFWTQPVNIQSFTNDFTFQLSNPVGDGFTFAIQGIGPTVLGVGGAGLGYGASAVGSTPGIGASVAVKFQITNASNAGNNATGLYTNGASPTTPAVAFTNGVNLQSGDVFRVHMAYDGTTLTMTVTDTANTTQTFTTSWPINIASIIGGSGAYIGFTGSTGGMTATQEILSWTYSTMGSVKQPLNYQTTALPATTSGPSLSIFGYSAFPDGQGTILAASQASDSVTFTLNVATPGTYSIKFTYKPFNPRGIAQLTVNGAPVGTPVDECNSLVYNGYNFGTLNFPTAGNYAFKFTVTGKNSSSSGYGISFDDIILTPQ